MTTSTITAVQLSDRRDLPLLVLGPSLGTSATTLWEACAARLANDFHIIAWDLPGHGRNKSTDGDITIESLAQGVIDLVDRVMAERGEAHGSFCYAGDSVSGTVGLQLLLDAPERVKAAVLLCTGAKIGDAQAWHDRAATVRASGTPVMIEGSATRWFSPGFLEREPEVGAALLQALRDTDRECYAKVCEALVDFDVRTRLSEISTPVLAIAGADDGATTVAHLAAIADGVANGRLVVLDNVAHLAPAEAPAEVANLLREHLGTTPTTTHDARAAGMTVRRAVLGDAHVDRSIAATTDFTRDFQDLITQYAWGSIWTRPGLDRRSRSLITLTAMVARGHHEELAMHVRAARTNGLTNDEIKELLLQTAIYCGVPDANTAFRIAQKVLKDMPEET